MTTVGSVAADQVAWCLSSAQGLSGGERRERVHSLYADVNGPGDEEGRDLGGLADDNRGNGLGRSLRNQVLQAVTAKGVLK